MPEQAKTLRRKAWFNKPNYRAEQTEEGKKHIKGYAVLFETPTVVFGDWQEIIDKGAFGAVGDKPATDLSDLRLLVNHEVGDLLARASINLKTEIDDTGLYIDAELPDTQLARDTWELVSKGIMDGMSFWFVADVWETDTDKKIDRILHFKRVYEVSVVTFPAYPETVAVATEQTDELEEPPAADGERSEQNNPDEKGRQALFDYTQII